MDKALGVALASVSQLQRHYARLLAAAKREGRPLLLLRKNKPTAVLLDDDSFDALAEKARLYEEAQALAAIGGYRREKEAGRLRKMKRVGELFR